MASRRCTSPSREPVCAQRIPAGPVRATRDVTERGGVRRAACRHRAVGGELRMAAMQGTRLRAGKGRLHGVMGGAARTCTSLSMKRSNASTYSIGRIAVWSYMVTPHTFASLTEATWGLLVRAVSRGAKTLRLGIPHQIQKVCNRRFIFGGCTVPFFGSTGISRTVLSKNRTLASRRG